MASSRSWISSNREAISARERSRVPPGGLPGFLLHQQRQEDTLDCALAEITTRLERPACPRDAEDQGAPPTRLWPESWCAGSSSADGSARKVARLRPGSARQLR